MIVRRHTRRLEIEQRTIILTGPVPSPAEPLPAEPAPSPKPIQPALAETHASDTPEVQ